ncbi:DUF1800 family protein [Caulobacter sp. UC70_42]|uniref:DUF1800 family protein n=1 Tax=Caulobacter sp. UC70_42 TaxID=3374551 RepID=UPI003757CAD6
MRFYANAISNDDQLRQRVAFALSQIIVASDLEVHTTAGLAAFNQILLDGAFGNYRDTLKAVTLNPYMGDFLDMADSDKSQPNENYARELMQLFSVGTTLLNADGTPQTDNSGATIATYSNSDVKEVARALTGWTYARLNGAAVTDNTKRDYSKPLVPYNARFDTGAKSFLGANVQANASQSANIDAVVDTLFNHPNTGPYICKRLIQQLIVANPTPAYVGRVAAAFADNGSGVRGDMKAVVRAIYLDSEARVVSQLPGKVKEPVLLATSLARAIGFKTDGYAFLMRDTNMGQQPFRAPSVFNYYPYDFPLPQGNGLVSPAGKLMTTSTVIARHNFIYDFTLGGDASRPEFAVQSGLTGSVGSQPNWAQWEALTADQALDRINLLMFNGTMTAAQRQAIAAAMSAYKSSDPVLQRVDACRQRSTSSLRPPSSKSIGKRMSVSRREILKFTAGGSALASLGQLTLSSALAADSGAYRAMVGVFLFGGNDAWNMVVPNDSRYVDYAKQRGSSIALAQSSLVPLTGTAFGLHAAMAPLKTAWNEGALGVVLNTGTLFTPLTKALYTNRPDLRPLNLMSHEDQQYQWQGMRTRSKNVDGFMGRLNDRAQASGLPPLISISGAQLALLGNTSSPLILPSSGGLQRNAYSVGTIDPTAKPRQAAIDVLADRFVVRRSDRPDQQEHVVVVRPGCGGQRDHHLDDLGGGQVLCKPDDRRRTDVRRLQAVTTRRADDRG